MDYFVLCTFDLFNADSSDYDNAYTDLESLGLSKVAESDSGKEVELPNTTVVGIFTGEKAAEVRDAVLRDVKIAFNRHGLESKVFVVASKSYAWKQGKTG